MNHKPAAINEIEIEFLDEDLDIISEYLKLLVDIDLEAEAGANDDSD